MRIMTYCFDIIKTSRFVLHAELGNPMVIFFPWFIKWQSCSFVSLYESCKMGYPLSKDGAMLISIDTIFTIWAQNIYT